MKRSTGFRFLLGVLLSAIGMRGALGQTEDAGKLRSALVFHAPFDGTLDARIAPGKRQIRTADSAARKKVQDGNQGQFAKIVSGAGRYGDALRFAQRSDSVLCYAGSAVDYRERDWSGSVSVWMRLDPNRDLQPGYCDPIQITDKTWNDAAFFVDFDKDLPRDFRLGVFSDNKFWNPSGIAWEKFPLDQRPMVTVRNPPFSSNSWTHVLFTFEGLNSNSDHPATATLYMNGMPMGSVKRPIQFHWNREKVELMIGIHYIGDLDDLATFNRALSPEEVKHVYELPNGIKDLGR